MLNVRPATVLQTNRMGQSSVSGPTVNFSHQIEYFPLVSATGVWKEQAPCQECSRNAELERSLFSGMQSTKYEKLFFFLLRHDIDTVKHLILSIQLSNISCVYTSGPHPIEDIKSFKYPRRFPLTLSYSIPLSQRGPPFWCLSPQINLACCWTSYKYKFLFFWLLLLSISVRFICFIAYVM